MINIKKILAICLIAFSQPLDSCFVTYSASEATRPCVKLDAGGWFWNEQAAYMCFCVNANISKTSTGAVCLTPCEFIGKYNSKYENNSSSERDGAVYWRYYDRSDSKWIEYKMKSDCGWGFRSDSKIMEHQSTSYEIKPTTETLTRFEGFDPKTTVNTPFGAKEIGTLEVGDSVVCCDFKEKKWTTAVVVAVKKTCPITDQMKVVKIRVGDRWICAGQDQNFFSVKDNQWKVAKELKVGDLLRKESKFEGSCEDKNDGIEIQEIVLESQPNKELVFLTLNEFFNFCVDDGVLVHNSLTALLTMALGGHVCEIFQAIVAAVIYSQYMSKKSTLLKADVVGAEAENCKELSCPQSTINAQEQCQRYLQASQGQGLGAPANFVLPTVGFGLTCMMSGKLGLALTVSTPGAVTIVFATIFSLALYDVFFGKTAQEIHRDTENDWYIALKDYHAMREKCLEIHTEHFKKACEPILSSTIDKCDALIVRAQELSPERDRVAKLEQEKAAAAQEQELIKTQAENVNYHVVEPLNTNPIKGCIITGIPSPKPGQVVGCGSSKMPELKARTCGLSMPAPVKFGCGNGMQKYIQDPKPCNFAIQTGGRAGPFRRHLKRICTARGPACSSVLNNDAQITGEPGKCNSKPKAQVKDADPSLPVISEPDGATDAKPAKPAEVAKKPCTEKSPTADDKYWEEWTIEKNMPKCGATIDGIPFTEHALERMAKDTPEVRAELELRWPAYAKRKGWIEGTEDYILGYENYIQPRQISTEEIKKVIAIEPVEIKQGRYGGTIAHHKSSAFTVLVSEKGAIVSVWHESDKKQGSNK